MIAGATSDARRFRLGIVAPFLLACGCNDGPREGAGVDATSPEAIVVRELERLAFVPPGRTFVDSGMDVGLDEPLLVDRYEVSVGLWRQIFPGGDIVPDWIHTEDHGDEQLYPTAWSRDVPIVGVTLDEAREAAALRHMRLPTMVEWTWCAIGARGRRFPAGQLQSGLANTIELGLGRTTPVGAFESGQTPDTGIHDLLGNVWEWVVPPMPGPDWLVLDAELWPSSGGRDAEAWIVGGSYSSPARATFSPDKRMHAKVATPGLRSPTVGFRCVVDARAHIDRVGATSLAADAQLRERVRAVGASWGSRAIELLQPLARDAEPMSVVDLLLEGASE